MSRVLVVGSRREDGGGAGEPPAAGSQFPVLCEAIGRQLTQRGHEIVVCSRSEHTADYSVVRGASRQSDVDRPPVRYFVSAAEREAGAADAFPRADFPNVDVDLRVTNSGWFACYTAAIDYVDAVIALGGTPRGTGSASYMALQKATPVLGIPAAGGVAAQIWDEFRTAYATLPSDVQLSLESRELERIASAAVEATEQLIAANPFAESHASRWLVLLPAAMLALGVLWTYASFLTVSGPTWLLFVMALVAAMAGMLFRFVNDDARQQVAYAGLAKWCMQATRVLGALFGVFILVNVVASQFDLPALAATTVLCRWLALAGFACGFLVEQVTHFLTQSIEGAVGGLLGGSA